MQSNFEDLKTETERQLVIIAEIDPDDNRASAAMKELRQRFDQTYFWCDDCDGLVVKEKGCCFNRIKK